MAAITESTSEQIEDVCESPTTEPVDLPKTLREFQSKVKFSYSFLSKSDSSSAPSAKTAEQQISKYSGSALKTGRPLDRVIIIMAGISGAGKSTTINVLFNDEICKTSEDRSLTIDVQEFGKHLCVTGESPPINGILSFVDVPGALDVDQGKEVLNMCVINKYRKEHVGLASRKAPFIKECKVKHNVYPNLVLMAVKASDNRMVGKDSQFSKSLRILNSCNIVDTNVKNLLVVVTHALNNSPNPKKYKTKCDTMVSNIQTAVHDVIGIKNVKVVFVENEPEDYNLEKKEGSDFYTLPDGQLSHHNLMEAMTEHFGQTEDFLGSLFCGWYFGDSCPEKQNEVKLFNKVDHSSVSPDEIRMAESQLHDMNIIVKAEQEETSVPQFPFEFLGFGFDPKTESKKNVDVLKKPSRDHTVRIDIHGSKYSVADCIKVVKKSESFFRHLSSETQTSYVSDRQASYGLEADVSLVVKVSSSGRWIKDSSSADKKALVRILYERRLANVRIDEPECNVKETLASAFDKLETPYDKDNAYKYNEFFSMWGTHIICEVNLGGFIEVNSTVAASTFDQKQAAELMTAVKVSLSGSGTVGGECQDTSTQNSNLDDQTLLLSGGDPPDVTSLNELTPELRSQWVESLKKDPTELKHSFKLHPYYHMVEGELRTSLRQATIDYLKDTISNQLDKSLTKEHVMTTTNTAVTVSNTTPTSVPLPTNRNDASNTVVKQTAESEGSGCFPAWATVYSNGQSIKLKDLKPNLKVLTAHYGTAVGTGKWKLSNTEMITYLHYEPDVEAEFLTLHFQNGQSLTITGGHLVFLYEEDNIRAMQAKKAQIGDKLVFVDVKKPTADTAIITDITRRTIKGVYCPLTVDGTLVVDGILVSCYASIESHALAHFSMLPLRLWQKSCNYWQVTLNMLQSLFPYFKNTYDSHNFKQHHGIHKYAEFLMALRKVLPLKNLLV